MFDAYVRRVLPRFSGPVVSLFKYLGFNANGVTFLGFFLAVVSVLCVLWQYNYAALGFWWLGRFCDGLDGIFARQTGTVSGRGAFFDITLDMAAYGLFILALAVVYPGSMGLCLGVLFAYSVCITSALALGGVVAAEDGAVVGVEGGSSSWFSSSSSSPSPQRSLRLSAGLAEAGETSLAYTLFLLWPEHLAWLLKVWLVVLFLTILGRCILAWRS